MPDSAKGRDREEEREEEKKRRKKERKGATKSRRNMKGRLKFVKVWRQQEDFIIP